MRAARQSPLWARAAISPEIGTEVEITATPYDAERYPGMEFVEWEIKYPDSFYEKFPGGIPENLQLKLDNAKTGLLSLLSPLMWWTTSPGSSGRPRICSATIRCVCLPLVFR